MRTLKAIIILWRVITMYNRTVKAAKWVGIGLAAGMATYYVGNKIACNKKCIKRKADKAIHAMGEIIDGVQYMFK